MFDLAARPLRLLRSAGATATTLRTPDITSTEPTGLGDSATARVVLDLAAQGGGGVIPAWLILIPFGTGAENDAFTLRVLGWRRIFPVLNAQQYAWMSVILADLTCTVGTTVGEAGLPAVAADRFCDTISIQNELTTTSDVTRQGTVLLSSPTNNLVAWVAIPTFGFERIEVSKGDSVNTPVANALYALAGCPNP